MFYCFIDDVIDSVSIVIALIPLDQSLGCSPESVLTQIVIYDGCSDINKHSQAVATYLWPILLVKKSGICHAKMVFKDDKQMP
ncbi:hypothetical protein F0562_012488 [Nyssa sinensis]|uniref:Uncharacterized protein n=1 Tax=Nyssa sinensis TaxID=561372 RepID=A0A5J4ZSU9_9ASTE|nr:hypothetical protein F0562_012488 [Nyssa sinensis]